ncbi:MAG: deoxyguanosinetriphosphate triphosphohydrolase [Clostridia bacterium]|nr:deoxyguanosinetriphosphate triphosphohydrolase [Clostridia bacterium]
MTIRESIEQLERDSLCEYATLSCESLGRETPEEPCSLRTAFQRDRDRIIHCKSFRRLKHKTQVYLAPEGDHYRTRLTHTLEVAQIARTIARSLRLNEDLTEAISLGHDLGHTPFGHAGERALNDVSMTGFRHYEQSVRVVEHLEKDGRGLNLTKEVRNGILCHTRGPEAFTPEGRIVKIADHIAYMNHDIDDSIRAGILTEDKIPAEVTKILGSGHSARIDSFITDIIRNSREGQILMSKDINHAYNVLHDFMFDNVYRNPIAKREEGRAEQLIKELFEYYLASPEELPEEYSFILDSEGIERATLDFIAGMSDHYAINDYKRLFIPRSWDVI